MDILLSKKGEKALDVFMKSFDSYLPSKSGHLFTLAHKIRVAGYSLLIADEMKIPAKDRANLELACLFHDLGKFFWDEKLFSSETLTEDDWVTIKRHPYEGGYIFLAEILPNLSLNGKNKDSVLKAIRNHHRDYNGDGYGPDDIGTGKDEPYSVRIMRIADSFDAITKPRLYKQDEDVKNIEEAKHELIDYAATRYCPECLEAFCRIENDFLREVHREL